jgi:hypothetical protein
MDARTTTIAAAFLGVGMLALLAMLTQVGYGEECTNTAHDNSGVTGSCGQGAINPTTQCDDGTPCGFTLTVWACANGCKYETKKCCICQSLRSYNQYYSCQGEQGSTTCVGGTKGYFGEPQTHCRTVNCTGGPLQRGDCDEVGEW